MKTALLLLVILFTNIFSQSNSPKSIIGYSNNYYNQNRQLIVRTVTQGESYIIANVKNPVISQSNSLAGTTTRWSFTDPVSIGSYCSVSNSGLYEAVGWYLNNERISLYGNISNTPIWEFQTFNSPNYNNFVSVSDTGVTACGSYHNIYIFNPSSSTPVFNYSISTDTAGPIDITSNGKFIVASYMKQTDTSTIYGFAKDSINWVWRYKIPPASSGGGLINGIRISGNDSLVIVNNYLSFYVLKTYTGQLVYMGTVNPINSSGTQAPQGISGNGNIIATINYIGYLRVLQWNGNTYNLLWQHQEPPGIYYNWMNCVDVSYDGSLVACGTFNFVTPNTQDGKVKLFKTANGPTPLWTYSGTGGPITCVSLSKNNNVLAATSWGDLNNTGNDMLIFKVSAGVNNPIYQLNTPGSLFWCSTSDDGSTVIASGKAVHAYQFGFGGLAYNIFVDTNDSPLGIPGANNTPQSFTLAQNYPNPFNPTTNINFSVPKSSNIKITIYDAIGSEIGVLINKQLSTGNYTVEWDGSSYSSGIYFYKMESNEFVQTRKMILIK